MLYDLTTVSVSRLYSTLFAVTAFNIKFTNYTQNKSTVDSQLTGSGSTGLYLVTTNISVYFDKLRACNTCQYSCMWLILQWARYTRETKTQTITYCNLCSKSGRHFRHLLFPRLPRCVIYLWAAVVCFHFDHRQLRKILHCACLSGENICYVYTVLQCFI